MSGTELRLNPGNVLIIYTDQGPGGPSGQSMNITCPHTYIHHFQSYDHFKQICPDGVQNLGRKGKRPKFRMVVVGEYGDHIEVFKHYEKRDNSPN